MDEKYSALFTPWKIGNVEIKNRIVQCSMGGTSLFGWLEPCHFDKEAANFSSAKIKLMRAPIGMNFTLVQHGAVKGRKTLSIRAKTSGRPVQNNANACLVKRINKATHAIWIAKA